MLDGSGAAQTTLDTMGFEGRKEGKPIPPRGFHSGRLDTTVDEPVRQGIKISRGRAKGAHALLVVAVRDAGHDLLGAHIDSSGVSVDPAIPSNGRAALWDDLLRLRLLR